MVIGWPTLYKFVYIQTNILHKKNHFTQKKKKKKEYYIKIKQQRTLIPLNYQKENIPLSIKCNIHPRVFMNIEVIFIWAGPGAMKGYSKWKKIKIYSEHALGSSISKHLIIFLFNLTNNILRV